MKAKITLLAILLVWGNQFIFAANANNEWEETPNRITLNGSVLIHNSDPGYGVNIDYVRFLNRFLGVKGGIGFQCWFFNNYKPQWEVTDHNGQLYHLDNDESTLKHLNFQFGPVFRLPIQTFGKDKDWTISWECHPSVAFTLPNRTFSYLHQERNNGRWVQQEKRVRNHGGQWNFWQLKNAVCLQNDVIIFSLGYSFANQQPYSAVKDVRFDGKKISASTPSVKLTHEIQASLGFCF